MIEKANSKRLVPERRSMAMSTRSSARSEAFEQPEHAPEHRVFPFILCHGIISRDWYL
jgi:hypothetical protein